MKTEIGELYILVDDKEVDFEIIELPIADKVFKVDKRYRLIYKGIFVAKREKDATVKCVLIPYGDYVFDGGFNPGEELELTNLYYNNTKLSIGTRGDIEGVEYIYLDNGIEMRISKDADMDEVIFQVAWVDVTDPSNDIYPSLAADLTMYN